MGQELFKLAVNLGWLNIVDRDSATDEEVYAFYHPTFQEYFAACAVSDWDLFLPKDHVNQPVSDKNYRIFEAKWKEIILLWIGRETVDKKEKEAFIKALVEFKEGCKDFYYYRAYFLAAVAIDQFKSCSLGDDIVRQIIKWGFGSFDSEKTWWTTSLYPIQQAAREILPETDRKRAITGLIDIIRTSESSFTRSFAAKSLGKIGQGNPEAIAALMDLIRTSKDEVTRYWAANSLGMIDPGNPEAIAALIDIIRTSESSFTRSFAAESLGMIGQGNKEAASALIDIIRTSDDKETRYWAAKSLGMIDPGNPELIAGLIDRIRNFESEKTRYQAGNILEKIDPQNKEAISDLIDMIRTSDDEYTRWSAADSLGKIGQGNKEAIATLIDIISTSEHSITHWSAAASLEKIIQDEQMAEVVKGLKDGLSDKIYENDFYRFECCYQVIWKCAQTLTYPEFYQAWHDLSLHNPDYVRLENIMSESREMPSLEQVQQTVASSRRRRQELKFACLQLEDFMLKLEEISLQQRSMITKK